MYKTAKNDIHVPKFRFFFGPRNNGLSEKVAMNMVELLNGYYPFPCSSCDRMDNGNYVVYGSACVTLSMMQDVYAKITS